MTLAHRYGWHKMEESHPEGDTMLWCHWCGLRVVTVRRLTPLAVDDADMLAQIENIKKEIASVGRVPRKFWHRR